MYLTQTQIDQIKNRVPGRFKLLDSTSGKEIQDLTCECGPGKCTSCQNKYIQEYIPKSLAKKQAQRDYVITLIPKNKKLQSVSFCPECLQKLGDKINEEQQSRSSN